MGDELTEFPIICSRCIGDNPYVKMVCATITHHSQQTVLSV